MLSPHTWYGIQTHVVLMPSHGTKLMQHAARQKTRISEHADRSPSVFTDHVAKRICLLLQTCNGRTHCHHFRCNTNFLKGLLPAFFIKSFRVFYTRTRVESRAIQAVNHNTSSHTALHQGRGDFDKRGLISARLRVQQNRIKCWRQLIVQKNAEHFSQWKKNLLVSCHLISPCRVS